MSMTSSLSFPLA
ncbi:hypothetical protein LINGRAHAP2_LOCUS20207 [Linum grandiflorum]